MKARLKNNAVVTKVQEGLTDIKKSVAISGTDISENTVKEIHGITEGLVKTIHSKAN